MNKKIIILIIVVFVLLLILGGVFYLTKGGFPKFGLLEAAISSLSQFNNKDIQMLKLSLEETKSELERVQEENYLLKEKLEIENEIKADLELKYQLELENLAVKLEVLAKMINDFGRQMDELTQTSDIGTEFVDGEIEESGEKGGDVCFVNINSASKEELQKITGIGPTIAQRIIDARPFSSIYDLIKVSGIGEITLQKIIDQGCAYVEDDTGPNSSGSISSSENRGGISLPPPKINLYFPQENPVNREIETRLSVSGLKSATYDVKIFIEKDILLSDIYNEKENKWQSSLYYLKEVFSANSFKGNFKLKIKEEKDDFRGQADILVRIRESGKSKYFEFKDKIMIINPEPEAELEPEPEVLTDTTAPQIIFNLGLIQTSPSFTIYFEITDPLDTVTPSGLDGFYFKWKEEDGEWQEEEYQEIEEDGDVYSGERQFEGEDEKTYYFQIKAKDKAGNESEWIESSTKISLPKTIVISEIQIAEAEFVELYNYGDYNLNISNFYFSYFSSEREWDEPYRNWQFPVGAIIPTRGYYLIGILNFPETGGNPNIDWQVKTQKRESYSQGQLSENGAIAIFPFDPKDKAPEEVEEDRIDAVGWGNTKVFEGNPTLAPGEDKSLQRIDLTQNGNDNLADFEIKDSTPTNSKGETKI